MCLLCGAAYHFRGRLYPARHSALPVDATYTAGTMYGRWAQAAARHGADAFYTGSYAPPCTHSFVPACCRVSDQPPISNVKASSSAPGQRPKSDGTRSDPDKWDEEEEW